MEDILDQGYKSNEEFNGPSLSELGMDGYKFDFGKAFEIGWQAFSKDIGSFILYTLVYFLLIIVSAFTVIGLFLIAMPLTAGFMLYGAKCLRGEDLEFNDFFGGFKFFSPLLGYVGLMLLIGLLIIVPIAILFGLQIEFLETASPTEINNYIQGIVWPIQGISTIASFFIQTFFFFTVPLIVLGELGTIDAIKWSFKLAMKNFWWILLFAFVVGILTQIGIYVCLVGILFTIPLGQCLTLGAYTHIVGLGNKREDF